MRDMTHSYSWVPFIRLDAWCIHMSCYACILRLSRYLCDVAPSSLGYCTSVLYARQDSFIFMSGMMHAYDWMLGAFICCVMHAHYTVVLCVTLHMAPLASALYCCMRDMTYAYLWVAFVRLVAWCIYMSCYACILLLSRHSCDVTHGSLGYCTLVPYAWHDSFIFMSGRMHPYN